MKKKNIAVSLDVAIRRSIVNYPSLYATESYELSEFVVMDQIFNVIGNGIRDTKEFLNEYHIKYLDRFPAEIPKKYIDGTPLFEVRNNTEFYEYNEGGKVYKFRKLFSGNFVGYLSQEEIDALPSGSYDDVSSLRNTRYKVPYSSYYPNFTKEYSFFNHINHNVLDDSWIEGGIRFYTAAKEYFSGDCSEYSSAFPRTKADNALQGEERSVYGGTTKSRMGEMRKMLTDYLPKWKAEPNYTGVDEITLIGEKYAVPIDYHPLESDDNLYRFMHERWQIELERITTFIDETLVMLHSELEKRSA